MKGKENQKITTRKISFKEFFDALPDGVVVLNRSFSVVSMNDAAESIFRISRETALGKPSSSFVPKEIEKVAKKAIEEERTVIGEESHPTLRGGDRAWLQAAASPLFSDKVDLVGAVLQIRDLESSKFLSKKNLQQVSASRFEDLIMGLAHELKNPLSGIRGAAQMLSQASDNIETEEYASVIIKEVERLRSLLDKLKQLEPFAEEVFEPVDIHEILLEIIYLESKSERAEEIEFLHNLDVTLPPVLGDRDSLKQVFLNLVKNAVQSISEKGVVEISTRWITERKVKGEKAISIEIKDTGRGIPKTGLEKVFSPFYTTKAEGSGLGLFLAYQIVAKHGGVILVESDVGKGTIFKVYLPIYN